MYLLAFGILSVLLAIRFLYKFVFDEPSLKKFNHPFQEEGVLYWINYVVYRIVLPIVYRRRNRFNNYSFRGKDSIGMGLMPTDEQVRLERRQGNRKINNAIRDLDEIKMSGFHKDGHMLDLAISSKPGSDTGRSWLYFILNSPSGKRHYSLPNSPQTLCRLVEKENREFWLGNDLKLWCMVPMKKWRILFNGFLKDENSGKVDHVKFSFIWGPFSSTLDHAEFVSNASLADALARSSEIYPMYTIYSILNQYDQWGTFHGSYSINDSEDTPLLLRGNKSRHIGNFSWDEVHRLIDIKLQLKNGTVVSINAISLKTAIVREMVWGYVELCGNKTNTITSTDFSLPIIQSDEEFPSLFSIRLHTDGEEHIVTLVTDQEPRSNVWGSTKWPSLDISISGVRASVTNLTQNFVTEGRGRILFGKGRDVVSEETMKIFEPLLQPVRIVDAKKRNEFVLKFSDKACCDDSLTGGKGSSLAMLTSIADQKFKVPSGFCVTIAAYDSHVAQHRDIQLAMKKVSDVCCRKVEGTAQQATEELQALFLRTKISNELRQDVHQSLVDLFGQSYDSDRFAVRSSAAGEDGEELSGAGQMETLLGCKGLDQICEAIVKCWSSLYGNRAVEYRHSNGQIINVGMSVVVQKIVAADTAGVLFTRHPTTGNPGIMTISANFGLGESVVSATCDPDSIDVKRTHDDVLSIGSVTLGKKQVKIVMNGEDGVETVQNSGEDMEKCCLSEEQIVNLAKIGVYVERCSGGPRDIEWALCRGELYLLQSRPITSLEVMSDYELMIEHSTPLMTDVEHISSGNVKEVLPGAVSPISNSFTCDIFMISLAELEYMTVKPTKPNPQFQRTGLSHNWHQFFNRLAMNFSMNKKYKTVVDIQNQNGFDVAMSGRIISDSSMDEVGLQRLRYISRHLIWRQDLNIIWQILTTKRQINSMTKTFENFTLRHDECTNSEQLANKFFLESKMFERAVTEHVRITMSSMIMNSMVFIELIKSNTDITDVQYGDFATLMSIGDNSNDVISADVPTALKRLSTAVKTAISSDEFLKMSKQEAVDWLAADNSPVRDEYRDFLKKHGHRCLKEFDWMSTTWSMEPTKLIDPMRAMINSVTSSSSSKLTIDEALASLKTNMSPEQKKKLRKLVLSAREYVAYREQAKSLLIRTIHEYRKEYIRLGEMMLGEGRIPESRLIMFMSYREVLQLIETRSPAIIQRAMRRKKLFPRMNKLQFPELSYGYPKAIEKSVSMPVDGSVVVEGTPVSKGIVEGTARVVTDIEDAGCIQAGDILITVSTDIAWSPYFPSLSGVVTELGGLISHGAVVAREYGIPCVVGAQNATFMFKSGDTIRLNGNIGKIEKLQDL